MRSANIPTVERAAPRRPTEWHALPMTQFQCFGISGGARREFFGGAEWEPEFRDCFALPNRFSLSRTASAFATFMIPHRQIAEIRTPEGGHLTLLEHEGEFSIRLNGHGLMNSQDAASERLLGRLGHQAGPMPEAPRFLVGGLGMGLTLRSLLDEIPPHAGVTVVELIPEVVRWNREFFAANNGAALDDPRVAVEVADVWDVLRVATPEGYDAILLDIDNGPFPLVQGNNLRIYYWRGIQLLVRALKPGGRVAFWSAGRDNDFFDRLCKAGFAVDVVPSRQVAGSQQSECYIYVADKGPDRRANLAGGARSLTRSK